MIETARRAISISSRVLKAPKLKRTVPSGKVWIVRWAEGAQWSPGRQRMPNSLSSLRRYLRGRETFDGKGERGNTICPVLGAVEFHPGNLLQSVQQFSDQSRFVPAKGFDPFLFDKL